ncbi:MAG: hypothetical protein LBT16_07395 [Treponema sp.]|jgi:hypothetical protein|nr:hypothetical protein [Treponema sp.]
MNLALIFSAVSLVFSVFSFLFLRSYIKRRTGSERILAEFREEADNIKLEINQATVRDVDLVEDRVKTLRTLLEDADRRIAVYARELERRRSEEEVFAAYDRGSSPPSRSSGAYNDLAPDGRRPGKARPIRELSSAEEAPPSGGANNGPENSVYIPAELFTQNRVIPETGPGEPLVGAPTDAAEETVPAQDRSPFANKGVGLGSIPQGESSRPASPRIVRSSRPVKPKPLPFSEQVAELYRAGFSANLIASRLGASVTEVELAIALGTR